MKVTIQRDILLPLLQSILPAVERKSSLEVLQCALIESAGGVLTLTASNMEIQCQSIGNAPMDAAEPFRWLVPARNLTDILKALPEKSGVSFSSGKSQLSISSGDSRFRINMRNPDDFPAFTRRGLVGEAVISSSAMASALRRVAYAVAVTDVRHYLMGALLDFSRSGPPESPWLLSVVGSDGHRLASSGTPAECDTDRQIILPRAAVLTLLHALPEIEDPVRMEIFDGAVTVHMPGRVFSAKLVEGSFPPWRKLIPQGAQNVFRADREALLAACRRVMLINRQGFATVSMSSEGDEIVVRFASENGEEAAERVAAEVDGTMDVSANGKYLAEVLESFSGKRVRMDIPDGGGVIKYSDPEDDSWQSVVMPVRK